MRKHIIAFIGVVSILLVTSCNEVEHIPILKRKLQRSIISKGDNIPDFNIKKDSADFLLVYLHKNKSLAEFKKDTKLDDKTVAGIIRLLESKDWITEINGELKPSVLVATKEDGIKLYQYAKPISIQIVDKIEEILPNIKAEFAQTDMAKKGNFKHWSFLILSNVLLDNWQIFEMEKNFLKQPDGKEYERPVRHGKYYYASIQENTEKDKEAFGLYGNAITYFSNEKMIAVYGNNRFSTDHYRKLQKSENHISNSDDRVLIKMAQDFSPHLLTILEGNREYAKKVYQETGYSQEISFEEFFLWWYHFIYTQATDEMKNRNLLTIPSDGNFDYERS